MDEDFDERAAVRAARAGDGQAFAVLVQRYQQSAFRAAWVIVRDTAGAEDIAQEAFVRAYRNLHRFRDGEPFRPWLLRIVANLALNEARARGRRQRVATSVAPLGAIPAPAAEREAEAHERLGLVVHAINELPLDDRVVLYLRYFLELPEAEIAVAIGKRPGTVKSRLHRAGGRLRAVIEQRYESLRPETSKDRSGA